MAEKILVVDDDLDTLRLVGMMLERQGYQILAASTGNQALTMAKNEKPDLIVLDLMMPDIDGEKIARRLRSDPDTKDILIIMFTAKTQLEDRLEGYQAGADDYLTKPAQPKELVAHVKAVLGRSRRPITGQLPLPKKRAYRIGLLAPKGGVGVSTLATNLGIALHTVYGKEVLVADFHPGSGTIGINLGYENTDGLTPLLESDPVDLIPETVDQLLVRHASGVRFLLASHNPRDARLANNTAQFLTITSILPHLAQYIVLDLPASLVPLNQKIINECDELILVTEPVPGTVLQTREMLAHLVDSEYRVDRMSVVLVNQVRVGIQLSISQVRDLLRYQVSVVFTAVPELAFQALTQKVPLVQLQPESITAQQFKTLAEKVIQRGG